MLLLEALQAVEPQEDLPLPLVPLEPRGRPGLPQLRLG